MRKKKILVQSMDGAIKELCEEVLISGQENSHPIIQPEILKALLRKEEVYGKSGED